MKKFVSKILVFILTVIFIFCFAACGSEPEGGAMATPPPPSSTPTATMETVVEVIGEEPVPTPTAETDPFDEFVENFETLNQEGEFISAFLLGEEFITNNPDSADEAIEMVNESINEYATAETEAAEELSQSGDYVTALHRINEAISIVDATVYGSADELKLCLRGIEIKYIQTVIDEAELFISDEDYASAVQVLSNGIRNLSSFSGGDVADWNPYSNNVDMDLTGLSGNYAYDAELEQMYHRYANAENLKTMVGTAQRFFNINGSSFGVITEDGELWTCGVNDRGRLADGSLTNSEIPKKVLNDVVSVSLMRDYLWGVPGAFELGYALKSDGTVWWWGEGYSIAPKQIRTGVISISGQYYIENNGDLYQHTEGMYGTKTGLIDSNVTQVSGFSTLSYVKSDGGYYVDPNDTSGRNPLRVLDDVKKASGRFALKNDGTVWFCFSDNAPLKVAENASNIAGDANNRDKYYVWVLENGGDLTMVSYERSIEEIAATSVSDNVMYLLDDEAPGYVKTDGSLHYVYSTSEYAQDFRPAFAECSYSFPTVKADDSIEAYLDAEENKNPTVKPDEYFSRVSAGNGTSSVIKNDGTLFVWGNTLTASPTEKMKNVTQFSSINGNAMCIDEDNTLYLWSDLNETPFLTEPNIDASSVMGFASGTTDDIVYVKEGYMVKDDGSLWFLDSSTRHDENGNDREYIDDRGTYKIAESVKSFSGVHDMDFNAVYWVDGAGTLQYSITPNSWSRTSGAELLSGVKKIASNAYVVNANSMDDITFAMIDENDKLWMWGFGENGELGNGFQYPLPFEDRANVLDDVAEISIGEGYALALTLNGDLYAWGKNDGGQLGTGDTELRLTPTKVMSNIMPDSRSVSSAGRGAGKPSGNDGSAENMNGIEMQADRIQEDKTEAVNNITDGTILPEGSVSLDTDTLFLGQEIKRGQYIVSENGKYQATMQDDGNFVLYSSTKALWATSTQSKGGNNFILQPDGNIVIYDTNGKACWSPNIYTVDRITIQNDANLVCYDKNGKAVWATNTEQ